MKKLFTVLTFSIFFLFPIVALADNPTDCGTRGGTWTEAGWFTSGSCSVPVGTTANPPVKSTAPAPTGVSTLVYTPLEPLPGGSPEAYASLSTYLNLVFKILLSIGAMIAVVTLVIGGITYMVSEIVDKKSEARRRIQAALVGLLLLLTCWLILHEINPNLTEFTLSGIDNRAAFNTGNLQAAGNNGQNTNPPPTEKQKTDCESPGGAVSGKTIQYYEAGSWVCQ